MKRIAQFCFSRGNSLAALWGHSQLLEEATRKICAHLPEPLNTHVQVANFKDGTLLLHVDASVWAGRLRFLTPQIVHIWQQEMADLPAIHQVKIKVRRVPRATDKPVVKPTPMSNETRKLLRDVAGTSTHPPLKAALKKLARKRATNKKREA